MTVSAAKMLFITFLISFSGQAKLAPSHANCTYYGVLESNHNCGPRGYFQKIQKLCQGYMRVQSKLSSAGQKLFSEVRFCLQQELADLDQDLTCENIYEVAEKTHVDCYVRHGYCELPEDGSRWQIMKLIMPQLQYKIWRKTAFELEKACLFRDSDNMNYGEQD